MVLERYTSPHQKIYIAAKHDRTMFPHRNIRIYTWTCPEGKTYKQIDNIWIDRRWSKELFNNAISY